MIEKVGGRETTERTSEKMGFGWEIIVISQFWPRRQHLHERGFSQLRDTQIIVICRDIGLAECWRKL